MIQDMVGKTPHNFFENMGRFNGCDRSAVVNGSIGSSLVFGLVFGFVFMNGAFCSNKRSSLQHKLGQARVFNNTNELPNLFWTKPHSLMNAGIERVIVHIHVGSRFLHGDDFLRDENSVYEI